MEHHSNIVPWQFLGKMLFLQNIGGSSAFPVDKMRKTMKVESLSHVSLVIESKLLDMMG